jgi:hypothetical protein
LQQLAINLALNKADTIWDIGMGEGRLACGLGKCVNKLIGTELDETYNKINPIWDIVLGRGSNSPINTHTRLAVHKKNDVIFNNTSVQKRKLTTEISLPSSSFKALSSSHINTHARSAFFKENDESDIFNNTNSEKKGRYKFKTMQQSPDVETYNWLDS